MKILVLNCGSSSIKYALYNMDDKSVMTSGGAKRLYLEGNTRLAASIHLYRDLGFKEVPLEGSTYDRCDIIMELKL